MQVLLSAVLIPDSMNIPKRLRLSPQAVYKSSSTASRPDACTLSTISLTLPALKQAYSRPPLAP